jgi:hypothetical protein
MPEVPTFRRLRKDYELGASLGYKAKQNKTKSRPINQRSVLVDNREN